MILIETLNSLAKVYPGREPDLKDRQEKGCMLKNEMVSFQAAYKTDTLWQNTVEIEIEAPEAVIIVALGFEKLRFDHFKTNNAALIQLCEKINRMLAEVQ